MEIQLTKGKYTQIDDEDFYLIEGIKWQCRNNRGCGFYASATRVIDGKKTSILMHRVILGINDKNINVDHIDGDGLNNHRYNLRLATDSQNNCNSKARKTAKSKYKGDRKSVV